MNSPILGNHFNECRGHCCDVTKQVLDEGDCVVQELFAVDLTVGRLGMRVTTVLCEDCLEQFVRYHFADVTSIDRVCRVNVARVKRAKAYRRKQLRVSGEGVLTNGAAR